MHGSEMHCCHPFVDEPCTEQHVELARGLLESVEATLEMTDFRRAFIEAEGLANVHVLLNRGVEKRSVDVKLAQLNVSGGCDGKEESHVGHADYRGERLSIVKARTLATNCALRRETSPAVDIASGVGLDLVGPHVVNDHAVGGKVDEFPRAVVYEG
jgi:hypothetical protein